MTVNSRNFNLDKVMKVSDLAMKTLPKAPVANTSTSSAPADIPVEISNGKFDFRRIQTGNIVLNNTRGDIALARNVLSIKPLTTNAFDGRVNGYHGGTVALQNGYLIQTEWGAFQWLPFAGDL